MLAAIVNSPQILVVFYAINMYVLPTFQSEAGSDVSLASNVTVIRVSVGSHVGFLDVQPHGRAKDTHGR